MFFSASDEIRTTFNPVRSAFMPVRYATGALRYTVCTIAGALLCVTAQAHAEELSFQEAVEAALSHDSQYSAAKATFQSEKEEIALSRSRLLPSIDLSARYSHEDSTNIYTDEASDYFNPDQPRSSGVLDDTYWRISLSQPLLDVSAYRSLKASHASVEAARYRLAEAEQSLVYRTTERYLAVLYNAQLVYLNKNIHEALSLKYQQSQRRASLGVGDELELLELESRRDLAQTDYLKAKSDLEDEKTKLKIITGRSFTPSEVWVAKAHSINPPVTTLSEEEVIASARNNQLFLESTATLRQAVLSESANKASYYPTLSLTLDYSDRDSDDEFRESEAFTAAINLSLNLYGGGKTSAYIRQATAKVNAQEARRDGVLKDSEQKISLAYARKKNLEERLIALKRSIQSSERYLEAAERGRDLNLRSQVDVLDARTQTLDVKLRLAEALNEYLLADLQLQYQSGQLNRDYVAFYDTLFAEALRY